MSSATTPHDDDALRALALANLPVPYHPSTRADAEVAVLAVLSLHRRARNTRACTGCHWTPDTAGGTSDGEATRRRNEDFNTHLAALITDLFR